MSDGKVLEFSDVSMVFGDVPAVDGLTVRIDPGRVTAFLGPNGAGKTTTLRILLGQLRPTRGTATIGGKTYTQIVRPAAAIGSVMSIATLERARRKTAAKHLAKAAKQVGVGAGRVREVLTIVGLADVGDMRIGSLSLGMKHRLAVAQALLGDPSVLVFDEPANGLDPEGIRWIRLLMRRFADEGRTVLMSSHLLSEVEQVADSLLVLNEGQLLFEGPIELLSEAEGGIVTVDSDDRGSLAKVLDAAGLDYRILRSGIAIDDTTTAEVGTLAAEAGVALKTLTQRGPTLEDIYLQIIDGTWTAPARTAALAPMTLTGAFADIVAEGDPEAASGESGSDASGDDVEETADATPEDHDDAPADDDEFDAILTGEIDTAGDDEADADVADTREGDDDAEDEIDASADDAGDASADDESDDDISESDVPSDGATESDDASDEDDDPRAGAALPGIGALAGLATSVRTPEDDDEDLPNPFAPRDEDRADEEADADEPTDAPAADEDAGSEDPLEGTSPEVRAAFATAEALDADAEAMEAAVVTQEEQAAAKDEWEAQLREMFGPLDGVPEPKSTLGFSGATFGLSAKRDED
ncbi:ABC transporter ATP-binding protein [Microbacterium sp. G2-8]|uniref:ABC transporter ATP-binding protein n=1 Tax=Microbacterium sp. G2-8 TaxID=2842454 RepID=UPI0027E325E8|nr:ABC transporter ATP-binding protein [Microbacterium sp. G2-8]